MTHQFKIAACVFVLGSAAGCGSSQASGSYPSDMTPERHCAAAAHERARAGEERRAAEDVVSGKTTADYRVRAELFARADKHERHAAQHERSAMIASGGEVPPCGPFASYSY